MGWDTYITVEFTESFTTRELVQRLLSCTFPDSVAGPRSFVVKRRTETASYCEQLSWAGISSLDSDEVLSNVNQNGVELWFAARRFDFISGGRSEETSDRWVANVLGESFEWSPFSERGDRLVIDVGDYKNYHVDARDASASKNLEQLVPELEALIELGACRIRGLDAERSADPSDCWLAWDADMSRLAEGLAHRAPLSADTIRVAASGPSPAIATFGPRDRPGIFSAKGTGGRLGDFFSTL